MYLEATFDSEAMPDNLLLHRLDAQGTGGDWRGLAGTGGDWLKCSSGNGLEYGFTDIYVVHEVVGCWRCGP